MRVFPRAARRRTVVSRVAGIFILAASTYGLVLDAVAQDPEPAFAGAPGATAAARGRYLAAAAGCEGCHTDKASHGAPFAGGRAFKTPYGTFYSPNITPDPAHGIGAWSQTDLVRALRQGIGPKGRHFYPVFPYPAFTLMTTRDMADIYAYLRSLAPQPRKNRPHDLKFLYTFRSAMFFWNALYLHKGPMAADPGHDARWNRGAYLARALGHCDACHTPRNALGGKNEAMAYAGTKSNPEGVAVPNITSDHKTGIGKWSAGDLKMLFQIGMLPDGDFVGGVMAEVVTRETSKLSGPDLDALIAYVKSIPAIKNTISKTKKPSADSANSWQ
ncbi:cytochrome c [Varunaivibrio sulfuroxidans]|uniref:Mono/diheme cytochrome c family protein n=1 Tax=Varunaivibrio sulfuroxidans TaxID=1773489 RepID=A0A4R3JC67_9PROT|nr:cytochrome c [Varunaivibrio sulfuroxidans]TCS62945.1 mono/diheme cytochrome c family protein [Varunaivibrio sulfuroxidans]WES31979.1 cytochrome c [Varunaivibrio sulfuroxidans]